MLFQRISLKAVCFLIAVLIVSVPLLAADGDYSRFKAAIYDVDLNTVQELIASGADVNSKDEAGLTPLMYAVINNSSSDIIKSLINAGATVNARNL